MSQIESIKQIINDCGGPGQIEADAQSRGTQLTKWAVYKWAGNGVPSKYWGLLAELSGRDEFNIFEANNQLRKTRDLQASCA